MTKPLSSRSDLLEIGDMDLTCVNLVMAAKGNTRVRVTNEAMARIKTTRMIVDEFIASGKPAYGITTGVGSQKNHVVDASVVHEYNRRLVKGHATRIPGPVWPSEIVRGALIVLLNGFACGKSGVSPELVNMIAKKVDTADMPVIDASGSVGASDLVPLAQTAEWLLSFPDAITAGLPKAKETLSLINCNAYTLSAGAHHIAELNRLFRVYNLSLAVTMEAFRCNLDAISEPVNRVHRRSGQAKVAQIVRNHLKGSALWQKEAPRFLQDPLSFRTATQVHGAGTEYVDWLAKIWDDELNTVNDNPIIDPKDGQAYSHGNMDTTRITLALDAMRQALAKIVDISGERIHKMQWSTFSGLPIGLAAHDTVFGGVQFLNFGHIAASLITSVKIWATPHLLISVGQLADGVEDTAGHAMHSVHDLERQIDACWKILAIETSIAVWAIHRRDLSLDDLGEDIREVYELVRPLLPIGTEGQEVFNISIIIDAIKRKFGG